MNELERLKAFIEDYRVLCKKHGLYIGNNYDIQTIKELTKSDLVNDCFLPLFAQIDKLKMSHWVDEWEIDSYE